MNPLPQERSPRTQSTFDFLANEIYLPGYMLLRDADFDAKGATFDFQVREPPVARGDIVHYLTPRGLHICVSQAGYALVEQMASEGTFEGIEVQDLRTLLSAGRVKITELYEQFRKEVGLASQIQGRFDLKKLRPGKMPVLKLDFSFANDAIRGYMTSVVAPTSMPQMNADLIRPKI